MLLLFLIDVIHNAAVSFGDRPLNYTVNGGKTSDKLPLVGPVGQAPDMTWNEMSVGSCHRQYLLRTLFLTPKLAGEDHLKTIFPRFIALCQ
jgi:hypothetical protein